MPDQVNLGYGDMFGIDLSTPTYNPTVMNTPGNIPGSNTSNSMLSLISAGLNVAGNIFQTRYAVPQLNQGQYIQNRQGVYYQGNGASMLPGNLSFGGGIGGGIGLLPILAIGGVVLLMMMKGK